MVIALLALLLAPLASCLGGPPFEPGPPEPAEPQAEPIAAAQPPARRPSPSTRLVVADRSGDLCVLDPDTGAVRSRLSVGAVDVLASRTEASVLLTVEPGEEGGGRVGRYELRGDALRLVGELPFDAPSGRLIDAGQAVVGMSMTEGFSLFRAVDGEGPGQAWSPVVSAASRPVEGELRLVTAGVVDEAQVEIRQATADDQGLHAVASRSLPVEGGCVPALFAGEDSFGRVEAQAGSLRVRWATAPLDGGEAPGAGCPHEARWLGAERGLAVLAGPAPALHLLKPGEARRVALGDEVTEAPSLLEHRLAYDAGRGRLWVVVGRKLRAVDVEAASVVAEGGCEAVAVAAVEGR